MLKDCFTIEEYQNFLKEGNLIIGGSIYLCKNDISHALVCLND